MERLLISEPPLQVLPSLAVAVGLNEAMVLQQMHYWLLASKHERDGHRWVYNTYADWQRQFPFWSVRTVRRAIESLVAQKFVAAIQPNRGRYDQTRWYRILYENLGQIDVAKLTTSKGTDCPHVDVAKLDTSLQETTQETTQERGRQRGWRTLPESETLTEPRKLRACDLHLPAKDVALEWEKFRAHDFVRPKLRVDQTWDNWVRRAVGDLVRANKGRPLGVPRRREFVRADPEFRANYEADMKRMAAGVGRKMP